jgi:hypothetical protein
MEIMDTKLTILIEVRHHFKSKLNLMYITIIFKIKKVESWVIKD